MEWNVNEILAMTKEEKLEKITELAHYAATIDVEIAQNIVEETVNMDSSVVDYTDYNSIRQHIYDNFIDFSEAEYELDKLIFIIGDICEMFDVPVTIVR